MKKIILLLSALSVVLSVCACSVSTEININAPEQTEAPVTEQKNAEKDGFQARYDELDKKSIEGETQQDMNISSAELYEEWDALLNDVYDYLKANKEASEFDKIKSEQTKWIGEKEAAVEKSSAEFEGGSMAPLAANTTAIEYTKNRCEYLISLID